MIPNWKINWNKIRANQKEIITHIFDGEYDNRPDGKMDPMLDGQHELNSTISSIDDKDLTILVRGEHNTYFDAKEEFLEIKK